MLILASRSPQRRAILEQLGIVFRAEPVEVEELTDGPAAELVAENARRKARAVAGAAVLGVDTAVALDGRVFGKPRDRAEAREFLSALSDRTHTVHSGICLVEDGVEWTAVAATAVSFRALGPELLAWYLATGEWRERAGGYAIQGRGAALVERIDGDYLNVVGLPASLLLGARPALLGQTTARNQPSSPLHS